MASLKQDSEKLITIPARTVRTDYLQGAIALPEGANAMIVFVVASRSSRQRFINEWVAYMLRRQAFGTMLLDLVSREESKLNGVRFQVDPLAQRLESATEWLLQQPDMKSLRVGYFATNIGAAPALKAAASLGRKIGAVVSASGRPDLAHGWLSCVLAPTLLIVGGHDTLTLELSKEAYDEINAKKRLAIIPDATRLLEEPGALTKVSHLASDWFKLHLKSSSTMILSDPPR